jgi:uncharacterized protein YaiL (DUF2058 family)
MSMSLREQLLAAGLGTKKQAKQAEREQHQQRREQAPRAAEQAARQAQAAKEARDQELNRKHREKAERKAKAAEIRQLIEQNRVPRIESEEYFNFIDGKKIHRIGVNAEARERIQRGEWKVVRYLGYHALVPADIAAKIHERDEHAVVKLDLNQAEPDEADPYKDHKVPDDLMW